MGQSEVLNRAQSVMAHDDSAPATSMQDVLFDETFYYQKQADDGAAGTATDDRAFVADVPFDCEVVAVKWNQNAALTGHAANYATFNVKKNDGAGGALTTVATKATSTPGTDDIAANSKYAIPLVTTATKVTKGQALYFGIAKAGTGVVVSEGCLTVRVRRV